MKNRPSDDEETGFPFRELFSEDETREFYQPVRKVPTRQIAFWSLGLSFLLAGALVLSSLNERSRPVLHPKAVPRSGKKSLLHPVKRRKIDTVVYLRLYSRLFNSSTY
ncbi:hypothetical protein [Larkinella sp.]|uniref:hypothetical protein n=1 Tax=Larkinella sp. TaxID=2034517 RepID=UPI003BAA590E